MCTSLALPEHALYGRNLDLDTHFDEQVLLAPRGLAFAFRHLPALPRHYAMVGMGNAAGSTPLFAEAANEKGLYMAGLYFPASAQYFDAPVPGARFVAPYELIPLVLGQCATVAEARALLQTVRLAAEPFAPGWPLAPLHWQVAGPDGVLVAEPRADGLRLYGDDTGVLTNEPPYPFHRANLAQYRGVGPATPPNTVTPGIALDVFGQGLGGLGLPGGASPAARFVRAAYLRAHAVFDGERPAQVVQFFHMLDAVAMVRGSVRTAEGRWDETVYSCCFDAQTRTYYYKTYDGGTLHAVRLDAEADGDALRAYPPAQTAAFVRQN